MYEYDEIEEDIFFKRNISCKSKLNETDEDAIGDVLIVQLLEPVVK